MTFKQVCWLWGHRLASLKFTLLLLVLLLAAVWSAYQLDWVYGQQGYGVWILGAPLAALTLNLLAAICTSPRFRRQTPLLMFHLALLAVALLVALGRLTYLKGWAEVTEGGEFDGQLMGFDAGPLHPWHIEGLRFTNERFRITYDLGPQRDKTFNTLSYREGAEERREVIGDQKPLVLQGYRFYTSFNKGFAPTFAWRHAETGEVVQGSVHLPSYPGNQYSQALEWPLPGTERRLWIKLNFDEVILTPDQPSEFRIPRTHSLVVRDGQARHEIQAGDRLSFPEGELHYLGLRTWMGYQIYYDETRYWLLAACLLAAASIGWFFWDKYQRTPWQQGGAPAGDR